MLRRSPRIGSIEASHLANSGFASEKSMQEAGGRAIERSLTLPVKNERASIGIKPEFSSDLPENSIANFTVIGVNADGQKQEAKGLRWKFYSLNREYQWYREGTA